MSAETGPELTGPPEPFINDEGEVVVLDFDARKGDVQHLGEWECQMCGTVMFKDGAGVANGELVEPEVCESCDRQGPFRHAGGIAAKDAKMYLRALGGDSRIWMPPHGADPEGFDDLWEDVRGYIQDHWLSDDPRAYEGLTAFAISTWVREELTFVPHLMLMGSTVGGKTRLLNTLKRVTYRGQVTASATAASLFRLIDAYDVTAYISEYHNLEREARREVDAVIRAGQKRGEVVNRAEPTSDGYEPTVFDPFTHIGVATQFQPDDDIVNRCLQVRSASPSGDKEAPMTLDEERGRELRNRLLAARYRLLDSDEWAEAEQEALEFMAERDITDRTREKLFGPLTVAAVWDAMPLVVPWAEDVVEQDRKAQSDSEDAVVVEAIRDIALDRVENASASLAADGGAENWGAVTVPLSTVAERYEEMTGSERSAAWVGHVRKRLGLEKERKRDGTVIQDPELDDKLRKLCRDHNLDLGQLEANEPVQEIDDGVKRSCPECGNLGRMEYEHNREGHKMCGDCGEEFLRASTE